MKEVSGKKKPHALSGRDQRGNWFIPTAAGREKGRGTGDPEQQVTQNLSKPRTAFSW